MFFKVIFPLLLSISIHSWTSVWRYGKDRGIELEIGMFLDKFISKGHEWSEDYKVVMNLWNNDFEQPYEDVTLATQCSVNNLHYLPELSARWNGPMSVAIFAPRADAAKAIVYTRKLTLCFPKTFASTHFHLIYPTKQPPNPGTEVQSFFQSEKPVITRTKDDNPSFCGTLIEALKSLKRENYVQKEIHYPHNTLRNVAMHSASTKFAMVLDIDTFPGMNIRTNFINFMRTRHLQSVRDGLRTAFVIPAFEAKEGFRLPLMKSELIRGYKNGNIRPFHSETCKNCHEPTRFSDWLSIPHNPQVYIAYEAEWKESWEPFYIAEASFPAYDERFKQYGFDRISQVCELFMAGYRFYVLNDAFVVHDGFKRPHKFHSTKNLENRKNYNLYTEKFIPDLTERYPNSSRTCTDGAKRRGIAKSKFRPHFKIDQNVKNEDL